MGKRQALLRRVTASASQAGSLAGYVYGESRRRGAAAGAALAGRRPSKMPVVLAAVTGLIVGAAAAVTAGRFLRQLPAGARRQIAVAKARVQGDPVGALIESARGADPVPARTPVLSGMVDE